MSDLLISDLLILLVEPSSTQRKVIESYLNNFGVDSVDFVNSAEDALETMARVVPDLIISAMHLPDKTGTDLLLAMREISDLSHVPFLLISSETSYRYLEPVRQAGAIAILPKPFKMDQLKSALRNTLDFIEPDSLHINNMQVEDVRVLLVDDSKLARKHIIYVLNNMGIVEIAEAENGVNAVEMMAELEVDLIVTDYNMPEMDGREFIQFVREESEQASVPILMVTSELDTSRLAMVEDVGVSAICDKPFDTTNIRTLLGKLLN